MNSRLKENNTIFVAVQDAANQVSDDSVPSKLNARPAIPVVKATPFMSAPWLPFSISAALFSPGHHTTEPVSAEGLKLQAYGTVPPEDQGRATRSAKSSRIVR